MCLLLARSRERERERYFLQRSTRVYSVQIRTEPSLYGNHVTLGITQSHAISRERCAIDSTARDAFTIFSNKGAACNID